MPMSEREFLSLGPGGFHRVAYTQWGNGHNKRVVICVHGLTRNSRDFDMLAAALDDEFRVICVDLVGRGRSQWLLDPMQYDLQPYMVDLAALIARSGAEELYWVGTSLGGLLGILLAAQTDSPIKRLIVNDVGAFIPKEALTRIGTYVGKASNFPDVEGVEKYLRNVNAPFGPLTDAQWRHLAEHSAVANDDGTWRLHYDPGIAAPYRDGFSEDMDLWPVWDLVRCPTLLLRGENSDLLPRKIADEMTRRGPKAELVEIEGVGHAPMLMDDSQIALARDWLLLDEGE